LSEIAVETFFRLTSGDKPMFKIGEALRNSKPGTYDAAGGFGGLMPSTGFAKG